MSSNIFQVSKPYTEANYKSKEYISRVCCDVIEDILKQTYDEENPLTTASPKRSKSTQTEKKVLYNHLSVRQKIFEELIKFSHITGAGAPHDNPTTTTTRLLTDAENYDSDVEDIYEVVENDFRLRDFDTSYDLSGRDSEGVGIGSNLEALLKIQDTLNQISLSLGQFVSDKLMGVMERNIFRIDNGDPPPIPNFENIPLDVRMVAYLLGQGDNRNVEELLRTVHQNIVVNVNMSYYFKMMLIMLTFNTLLLFKWILWDQWPLFP